MRSSARAAASTVAIGFLALHLPFLPASLEDLDSINFALGLHRYDIAHHQPHPPGYPVFVLLARLARHATATDAHALAVLGIAAGALGVLALFALFTQLEGDVDQRGARGDWIAWAATLVAATSPLYWFTASRPLSDVAGLAAAVAVQAWTLAAATPLAFAGAAFAAGLAAGVRSQVVWLTVPVLVLAAGRRAKGRGAARWAAVEAWAWIVPFGIGALVWAIPMVIVTGGPAAYWRVLFSQGAEDLSGVQMLWTSPTPRVFVAALYYAFVAPWALWSIAVVVMVFAILGAALTFRYWPRALVTLAVLYGPYLAFDILFQETFTTRYALPLVVPVAYLGVRGAAAFGWRPGLAVAIALSVFDAHVGGTSIAAYAREKAPAFRMLDDMDRAPTSAAPVLAMDRREQLDLRRPMAWLGDRLRPFAGRLPSPPQHEWLELVRYWDAGGRAPAWFVADPLRTDIDLVQHGDPVRYRWSVPYPVLLGGVRPNEMDWYRIVRPSWYVGDGWALTPEAAGVSTAAGVGLATGPIRGRVHLDVTDGGAIAIGGRNFDPANRPRLTIEIGQRFRRTLTVAPGAFLDLVRLPPGLPDGREYQPLTVTADPPARVAIEQFDAEPAGRVVFGFGDGWNEQEYNPATGKRWRWLSERGDLLVLGDGRPVRLHLEGESPRRYFSKPSHLVVRVGARVAFEDTIDSDFGVDVTIPAALVPKQSQPTVITVETDQVYVPSERSSRTRDRRHLGLRIWSCDLKDVDR